MSSYLEWKKRALIMGSGGWWLPQNFDPENCIAAYQFKDAGSKSAALEDRTGHGYTLSESNGSVLYDTSKNSLVWNGRNAGYSEVHDGYLESTGLSQRSKEIRSLVVRYEHITINASNMHLISSGYFNDYGDYFGIHEELSYGNYEQPGFYVSEIFQNRQTTTDYGGMRLRIPSDGSKSPGCIGVTAFTVNDSDLGNQRFNDDETFVYNAVSKTLTNGRDIHDLLGSTTPKIGGFSFTTPNNCAYTIIGAAFYKVALTVKEFQDIHERLATV